MGKGKRRLKPSLTYSPELVTAIRQLRDKVFRKKEPDFKTALTIAKDHKLHTLIEGAPEASFGLFYFLHYFTSDGYLSISSKELTVLVNRLIREKTVITSIEEC